jgi:hypothetical protein
MDAKSAKTLDDVALNTKQKWDARCVEHMTGISVPASMVVKQMTLVGD